MVTRDLFLFLCQYHLRFGCSVLLTWAAIAAKKANHNLSGADPRAHTAGAQPQLASAEGAKLWGLTHANLSVLICVFLASGNKIPRLS
jgi:hypothetical protein